MRPRALHAAALALAVAAPPAAADPATASAPSPYRQFYSISVAEDACRDAARDRGYSVRAITRRDFTGGFPARGAEIGMVLRRDFAAEVDATCAYTFATRRTVLEIDSPRPPAYDFRPAEQACHSQARREGVEITRFGSRSVISWGGRPSGARFDVSLRVSGDSRTFSGTCEYLDRTRSATLDYVAPRPPEPSLAEAENACRSEARRIGLDVRRIAGRDFIRSGGRITGAEVRMDVRRDGQSWQARCEYSYRDRSADIRNPRPPGGGGDGGGGGALDTAERACMARFRSDGFDRITVQNRRLIEGNSVASIWVIARDPEGYANFWSCDYRIRDGRITLTRRSG